jgi:hypothetical protein
MWSDTVAAVATANVARRRCRSASYGPCCAPTTRSTVAAPGQRWSIRSAIFATSRRLRARPLIPRLSADPSRVRQGFFAREEVATLGAHLDGDLADVVTSYSSRPGEWARFGPSKGGTTIAWMAPSDSGPSTARRSTDGSFRWSASLRRSWTVVSRPAVSIAHVFHRDGRPIGDFRKAAVRGSEYVGQPASIVTLRTGNGEFSVRTRTVGVRG